jgi:hypothetical protein
MGEGALNDSGQPAIERSPDALLEIVSYLENGVPLLVSEMISAVPQ